MNLFKLSFKLIGLNARKKSIAIIPFLGTSLGIIVFILTFTLMESIEMDMNNNISRIIPKNKIVINNLKHIDIKKITNFLENQELKYYDIQEGKFLLRNEDYYNIVNLISINKLNLFIKNKFENFIDIKNKKIDFVTGPFYENSINLVSLVDMNFFTGIPKEYNLESDAVINYKFMNFDENNILISSEKSNYLGIKYNNRYLSIDSDLSDYQINQIMNIENNLKIINRNQEYSNLFNSIEMEKILYSIIGIIIIIISNFTFLISLSSLILNKIKQFGILQAIGYSNKLLSTLILIYSLVLNSISLLIGISLSYLIVYLNDIYDFVGLIFNNSLLFSMNYHISYYNIIFILLFTFLSIFLSSIYPVKLLINLNLKNKIHYIK